MSQSTLRRTGLLRTASLVGLLLAQAEYLWADAPVVVVQPVLRSYAATAYSANVLAQADYLRAQGDVLESVSRARVNDARAASQEMMNATQWVRTYFERRRLNQEYRQREHPGYLEREALRTRTRQRLVTQNFQVAVQSDLTELLNWMLLELTAGPSTVSLMPMKQKGAAGDSLDVRLTKDDIHHLRLSDGVGTAKSLVFRADSADLLEVRWPRSLREPAFDEVRAEFEQARDAALAESKSRDHMSRDAENRLMASVDHLCDIFNSSYPAQDQLASQRSFSLYTSGKRFLQSLALSTYRLIDGDNPRVLDGSLRFQGETTTELLRHMMIFSLEFAPPEPGDEPVYRKVAFAIRGIYLNGSAGAQGDVVPKPGSAVAE